jgi:hypothetical protein
MENAKRTDQNKLIIEVMELVHTRLIEFKRKVNSELVVLKGDKIVRIKP